MPDSDGGPEVGVLGPTESVPNGGVKRGERPI